MVRLTVYENVSRGVDTHTGARHEVPGHDTAMQTNARADEDSRLDGMDTKCSANGPRDESRTLGDDVRDVKGASLRLLGPATSFDDMTAAPVLSAVLAARVDGGVGGLCGGKSSSSGYPRRRTTGRRSTVKKFREAFAIGVCLLSIIRLPAWTFAVPLGRATHTVTMAEDRFNSRPKWINACGAHVDNPEGRQSLDGRHSSGSGSPVLDPEGEVTHLTDEQLVSGILIVAKGALMHAEMWRRDYVNQTFNLDFIQHHEAWRTNRYGWLPGLDEIPKELDGATPEVHLEKLTFIDALKNAYTFMQKYACGLEQVTWDLEDRNAPFSKNFKDAELQLRDIICEIEVALIEKGEKTPVDVQRSIMPKEFRTVNHLTHRNLRDWLIFRDYMNGVEYVIQIFEFLKAKME